MSSVYLRLIESSDMDLLYEWANDKSVRSNSFNEVMIPYNDHKQWFDNCIKDKNIAIYMLCDNDSMIGQIRLECSEHIARINYSISKNFRGRGYGTIIVKLAEKKIAEDKPKINCLQAFVKKDNIASQKVFAKNGYTFVCGIKEEFYLYIKELSESKKEG